MNCFGKCKRIVEQQKVVIEEKVLNLEKCFEQCRQIEERIKKLEEEFHRTIKVEIGESIDPKEIQPEIKND